MRNGSFKGVVLDYGINKAQTGTLSVFLRCAMEVDGNLEELTWFGYLTDKAKARTIETLYKIGFNDDIEGLAKGKESNAINTGTSLMFVVESEVYEGKDRFKIKWINLPGETGGIERLDAVSAKVELEKLKADFLSNKPVMAKKKLSL